MTDPVSRNQSQGTEFCSRLVTTPKRGRALAYGVASVGFVAAPVPKLATFVTFPLFQGCAIKAMAHWRGVRLDAKTDPKIQVINGLGLLAGVVASIIVNTSSPLTHANPLTPLTSILLFGGAMIPAAEIWFARDEACRCKESE